MTHCFEPNRVAVFCPKCHAQHEDFGEWSTRPHSTHRCMFCENEWRPFSFTTVGIPLAALPNDLPALVVPLSTFERMSEYSCSVPTSPRSGRYWRRRSPYIGNDRDCRQYLGLALESPDDPPGEISLIWRRLFVAEWLVADALLAAFEVAA